MSGEAYGVMTPVRKQEWSYIIDYFDGDTQYFMQYHQTRDQKEAEK